jgi:energy-coupling factor transporter ATP-binding protein EcfA2
MRRNLAKPPKRDTLRVEAFGPVIDSRLEFGDLTVLVGPQASGKSLFLQTLKLVLDRNQIISFFEQQGTDFKEDASAFLDGYFGRGMGGLLTSHNPPHVTWQNRRQSIAELSRYKKPKSNRPERLFYIPAQRVVSLPSGKSQPFGSFDFGDPYVLRYFAHQVHILLQNEFGIRPEIFPAPGRLNDAIRKPIAESVFGGARLVVEPKEFTKTLALNVEGLGRGLPFLAWSAGQREFVPLLLGVYWLCPSGKTSRRDELEWVVIEEPEMGLHPRAIEAFLILVMELLRRGYRVVLSTHSPTVLDLVWAIRNIRVAGGSDGDVRDLFGMKANTNARLIAEAVLKKDLRVYSFERGVPAVDISELDVFSADLAMADWGGLTTFSSRASEIVSRVVASRDLAGATE